MGYLDGSDDIPISLKKEFDNKMKPCYPLTRDIDVMLTDSDVTGLATVKDRFANIQAQKEEIDSKIADCNRKIAAVISGADDSSLESMKLHFTSSDDIKLSEDSSGEYLSLTHTNVIEPGTLTHETGSKYLGDYIRFPVANYDKNGHITSVEYTDIRLEELKTASSSVKGGFKLGNHMSISDEKLYIDYASEENYGLTRLTTSITNSSSLASATEKAVYDAIVDTKQYALNQATKVYNDIMGGSTKETLDTIHEVANAIEELGDVDKGLLEKIETKSPIGHEHNYAGSTIPGGDANTIVTVEDLASEIYLIGVTRDSTNSVKRNTNIKVYGSTLEVPSLKGNLTGNVKGNVTGNSDTASKLKNAVTIGLSGAATGTATSFNGSNNITIPVTSLDASKLTGTTSVNTSGNAGTATKLASTFSLTLGNKTKDIDGSTNVSYSFTEMGVSPNTHRHANATSANDGFMSVSDKVKIDGIEANANKYIHPSYTPRSSGLYKVTVDASGHVSSVTPVVKSDITALGIPGTDTQYGNAGGGNSGLMTDEMVTKLNGIEANANKYIHPSYTSRSSGLYKITVDSTGHVSAVTNVVKSDITGLGIPAQDTTYSDATTSAHGLMTAAMVTKLNGIAAGANAYTHPSYTPKSSGLYKVTVDASGHVSATSAVTKADITALGIPGQDTNTDTKVTQTAISSASYTNWRPIVWGASNSGTEGFTPSTVTDQVYTCNTVSMQPSSGTVRATTFKGNLTGNVTGNVSGSSGSCTGNAATASSAAKLTTRRKISLTGSVTGSVTFDGSGDVSISTSTNHSHNYAGSSSAGGSANSLAGFTNTTTSATAIDSATQNGHVYVNGTAGILGQSDGACFVQAYSTTWVAQIYQDYRTGQIALRGKNNGTWQSWRKVLDSSNYSAYEPPLYIQTNQPSNPTSGARTWFKLIRTE